MARNSTPRPAPVADAPASLPSPSAWHWATDLANQQVRTGGEGAALLFRGFDAMRKIQEQAAQQAIQRHAVAARQFSASPADALAAHTELMRADFEDAARCWQQLLGEALEVGSELTACATRMVNTDDAFAAVRLFHRPRD